MPGQDRTGPNGQGPLTGRGLGLCGQGLARGRNFGRGMGRGFGRCINFGFAQPQVITETQEKEILKQELEAIKSEQAEIQKRLKELK